MTDKINPSVASAVSDVIEERKEQRQMRCNQCGNEYPPGAVGPSTCSECGETMHIHLIEDPKPKVEGTDDVFVSLGDLSGQTLASINTGGKNYEAITLDYIATFNGAVTQGVNPMKALLAMVQACAIAMSQCIRAGMEESAAIGMVVFVVNAARKAKSEVKIITKQ